MSKTPSKMILLGTKAPYFQLEDVITKKAIAFNEQSRHKATVIFFICNHCPYVRHINNQLTLLSKEYQTKGIYFLAINANDVSNYPDDSPEKMIITAEQEGYSFPYLFDESQEIAKAYNAACTPDFFIYDDKHLLVYRGQFDDSRPGNNIPVTGDSIRQALDCILKNSPLNPIQKPSLGCNIKWKT